MSETAFTHDVGLFQTMEERHSVRKYDPKAVITDEEIEDMLEKASTAPSSWNLQHWRFLVIDDEEKKQELLPIAYYQQQIVDSSVTVAILGDLQANLEADTIFQEAVDNGFMTDEIKNTIVTQIHGAYEGETPFARDEAVLNASLAAMQLMLAAKAKGYDTCPMGGFQREPFIEAFNIPERYVPVMLLTIGKPAKEAHASARKAVSEVTVKNSF
ncbi:nitroreductase family protein [Salisediminibacterium halotolerans]|uniref:Nitroreductase n=1 Tax=Salisediminibacterium halotolerans TaxID=517425 RepID=A0A1H9V2B5_9BACI|nr:MULTISPECIES: nitroreductase family protein [Salisediminibacterium]RLJ71748.1 nitroreductase [Actinophytocola xinjiangensis]RPE86898.1 nitroreductase [Salisediminibacterium halotolerans]TWG32961.1 nitroreductase [Salisediminibacterium halotolerans]SES15876.1 Nitroreductase [Salisediminibacterium haloalkalitolerans]GEL08655.1 putative NAD(P)H nitroreductase YodC [Salisediminibacterium halotolerans]